jgi:hypothetical protein
LLWGMTLLLPFIHLFVPEVWGEVDPRPLPTRFQSALSG